MKTLIFTLITLSLITGCQNLATKETPIATGMELSVRSEGDSNGKQLKNTEIPPLQKAPNDESDYRRFILTNIIKEQLLSDPKLNKSSAALAVGVGSLSDPKERQGLAHFLEHMLFLGTEKYPDESDYGNYLKSNGGYNNAYTAEGPYQLSF